MSRLFLCHESRSASWRNLLVCAFLLSLCVTRNGRSDETTAGLTEADVAPWLASEILPPGLVNYEFRQWCEPRIATVPVFERANDWRTYAERIRQETLNRIVMRGVPPAWRKVPPQIVWGETLEAGAEYRIRKLRYEALPGLWIPALLYEPKKLTEPVPAALHVNGHDAKGKAAEYKQIRSINLAKRGCIVLDVEWLGMGQLRREGFAHGRMNQLELAGTSGLAPFYLSMQRALDVIIAQERADPKRVAVAGLSGGGWQTIFLSSLDPRVTLANPVAGYSSFRTRLEQHADLGDSEQTPTDMATIVDYTHLTALRAPRPTLLTYNAKDDCCFVAAHALPPLLETAAPVFTLLKSPQQLRHHVNNEPGTHNFERENREAYYAILADSFAPPGANWPREEIECASELKTAAELTVDLPAETEDFHTLALQLAQRLPRDAAPPAALDKLDDWRRDRRRELARLLHTPSLPLQAHALSITDKAGVRVTRWRLRLGDSWTVPVVELTPPKPTATTLIVADQGRKSVADLALAQLKRGRRVIAVDPFYLGESAFPQRAYLFALMTATVGDRPLGLQTRQIRAIARWAGSQQLAKDDPAAKPEVETAQPPRPVDIVARGPRSTLAVLCAAALDDDVIARAELHESLGTLHEVLERNWSFEQAPECFCFGLLERFDVRSLVELTAPREVLFVGADPRVRKELATVAGWYQKLGRSFSPVGAAE